MMKYRGFGFLCVFISLIAFGCSSSYLTGSWKNPEYTGQVKKVYIVGIAKQDTVRRIFEEDMRQQLSTYGVSGIASYHDLGAKAEKDKAIIKNKASSAGADSVMVTRAVGKRTEQVVNPGRVTTYDYGPRYSRGGYYPDPYYRNYGSYYSRSYDTVYEPATITDFEVITLEANLYDLSSEELIWGAQLETVVDNNMDKLVSDFVKQITKDLKEKGLL
jgi:hypothetical protein